MKKIVPLLIIAFLLGALVAWKWQAQEQRESTEFSETTTSVTSSIESKTELPFYGTLLAFNPNDGFGGSREMNDRVKSESWSWSDFFTEESTYETYLQAMKSRFQENIDLAKTVGFSIDREIPGVFSWNVIEPFEGESYVWDIPDAVVAAVNAGGMSLSAVIQPFAAWDQTTVPENCSARDFAYYDYKAGTPSNWEAYRAFLTAAVERYDGDGVDDMPHLTIPIKYWEIGNEYDGTCGGDLNEAENLFELQKISYETIKAADAEAQITNAGAVEINSNVRDIQGFWEDFFELGGGDYLDIFNFHYNRERFGAQPTDEDYVEHLKFFSELMEEYDTQKLLWITEFGTYSGDPESHIQPDGGQAPDVPEQSESFQAAWYFRYSILGFSYGVKQIFIDFKGKTGTTIGGSALLEENGEPKAFLSTLQTIAEILGGFKKVEKTGKGQYQFTLDGKTVYALWEGPLPANIIGKVEVVDHLGNRSTIEADGITYSEESPILVYYYETL